jgi:Terminase large subunit, T4likevirus-type, N-terminal
MITAAREIAYRLDPVLWVREVLGVTPHAWQERFLRAPRGRCIAAKTARQVGKSTVAAWGMAHSALFAPGSLSVVASPTQTQSAEVVRKVREMLVKAGAELTTDNVHKIELANGSRVLALPGTDDSIRGLTVDAWIVVDEAARVDPAIMAALHPMRIQRPNARFVMLSTAWSRTDPFWSVWANDDPSWLRIPATVDVEPDLIKPHILAEFRARLSEDEFKREFLGTPAGSHVSPFTFALFERATQTPVHRHTWDTLAPVIIAHDVGRSRDRSTAVVGGTSLFTPGLLAFKQFEELPQGLFGSARAEALAQIDRLYDSRSLIIADISNDPTYAEILYERFGQRVIGLQITRHGDGLQVEHRPIKNGCIWVYTIGRTHLLDLLHREMDHDNVRILPGPESLRAYEQLMVLDVEVRESGRVYVCPPGQHDDLAISCAMVTWAALHPHLEVWKRALEPRRVIKRQSFNWGAFV